MPPARGGCAHLWSRCHALQGLKNQTQVKLNIVSCPPVTTVLIKRPDLKYQLGFSVQNGIVSPLSAPGGHHGGAWVPGTGGGWGERTAPHPLPLNRLLSEGQAHTQHSAAMAVGMAARAWPGR